METQFYINLSQAGAETERDVKTSLSSEPAPLQQLHLHLQPLFQETINLSLLPSHTNKLVLKNHNAAY